MKRVGVITTEKIQPLEQHQSLQSYYTGDFTGYYWEKQNPAEGVSPWFALYHFIDPVRAGELYFLLHARGLNSDFDVYDLLESERRADDFELLRYRSLLVPLAHQLQQSLADSRLVAEGLSSSTSLDSPRQKISADRWSDLNIDLPFSRASAPGYSVTQLRVFDPKLKTTDAGMAVRPPNYGEVRDWYIERMKLLDFEGARSSRDQDIEDADAYFGIKVSRKGLREIRGELAPEHWKQKGRKKKAKER